ncbi:hypothetical protein [Taibaiella koreensis]|uniref:hypothetical protein n=1 Tax=Taibaiella koreensis TaxID=1268548 RepID=UPI000E5A0C8C|nr:hypothetical protein [Taibaiella koreensis]
MEQQITIDGEEISVTFDEYAIHITNDEALKSLLETGKGKAIEALVVLLKQRFRQLFGKALDISDASLVVEIWGHVYFGYLAQALDNLVRLKLVTNLMDKVIDYCATIDCGEKEHDNNRVFWDMLAPFQSHIVGWLPDELNKETDV